MSSKEENIIDQIQEVRSRNNKLWMDILRLAFSTNKKEAKKIFTEITENDRRINKLSKELSK